MKGVKAIIIAALTVTIFLVGVVIFERWKRSEVRRKQNVFCSIVRSRVLNSIYKGTPLHLAEQEAVKEARYNPELGATEVSSWDVSYRDASESLENPRMEIIFHHPEYNIKRIDILYSPNLKELLPTIKR